MEVFLVLAMTLTDTILPDNYMSGKNLLLSGKKLLLSGKSLLLSGKSLLLPGKLLLLSGKTLLTTRNPICQAKSYRSPNLDSTAPTHIEATYAILTQLDFLSEIDLLFPIKLGQTLRRKPILSPLESQSKVLFIKNDW